MVYDVPVRTQLILDAWQYDSLKSVAEKRATSISHVVREAVSAYLGSTERESPSRLEDLRGLASDTGGRGTDHDRLVYLAPVKRRRGRARRSRKK